MKSYQRFKRASNGVDVAGRRILMLRHDISKCCKSALRGQIFTTFHTFDGSPGLNTRTSQYSVKVIAPPIGDRKCHVLRHNVLVLDGWPGPPQSWSVHVQEVKGEKLSKV